MYFSYASLTIFWDDSGRLSWTILQMVNSERTVIDTKEKNWVCKKKQNLQSNDTNFVTVEWL